MVSVDIWLAFPDEINEPNLLAQYESLLNEQERHRWQRFHFARHRQQYLVTRALVRTTLSRYASIAPQAWRFVSNEHGRPAIAPGQIEQTLPLQFNLSHTDGLIACAVALDCDLGVDVEDSQRSARTVDIAERFFSAQECCDLRALDRPLQVDRFFDYWTLKESYIKARGMGLALPLGQFSFHLNAEQPERAIRISFDERLQDDPQRWQFRLLRLTDRYRLALCASVASQDTELQLTLRKVVPLHSVASFAHAAD